MEITSFLLRHLYEMMADNYKHAYDAQTDDLQLGARSAVRPGADCQACAPPPAGSGAPSDSKPVNEQQQLNSLLDNLRLAREQETNQQIVSFLTNNQLPDLACESFIELLFISVFLVFSWIFVMIVQLHYNQFGTQSARAFYCNTNLLAPLMYCNNRESFRLAH